MFLRSRGGLLVSLRAMSIFAFYYYFYDFTNARFYCVERSSTVPAEHLLALTNHHTKEGNLTQKEGWDEAITYVYL